MTVALGLGANLGPAEATLRRAVALLSELLAGLRVAPLFRSRPISPLPQPDYLNTAVVGASRLAPEALLAVTKRLELAAGRRRAARSAARALDIDLLIYGELLTRTPELTLPHPRLRQRRFVLAPLAVVAPDLAVPPDGAPVRDLLRRVGQEGEVELVGWSREPATAGAPA